MSKLTLSAILEDGGALERLTKTTSRLYITVNIYIYSETLAYEDPI